MHTDLLSLGVHIVLIVLMIENVEQLQSHRSNLL